MDINFSLVFFGVNVIFALLWYFGNRKRKSEQFKKKSKREFEIESLPVKGIRELPSSVDMPMILSTDMSYRHIREKNDKAIKHHIRLETATPEIVIVNRIFDIAVAIKELASPKIKEDDLPNVKATHGLVYHAPEQKTAKYRVEVQSPNCNIPIQSKTFLLDIGYDSEIQYFQLMPKVEGKISIHINAYQVDDDELIAANTRTQVTAIVEAKATSYVIEQTTQDAATKKLNTKIKVFTALTTLFIQEELAEVCFKDNIDWQNLKGETKKEKAISLITRFEHRGDLSRLIQIVKEIRPNALLD